MFQGICALVLAYWGLCWIFATGVVLRDSRKEPFSLGLLGLSALVGFFLSLFMVYLVPVFVKNKVVQWLRSQTPLALA